MRGVPRDRQAISAAAACVQRRRRAGRPTGRGPARARRPSRSRGAPVKPKRSRSGAGSRPARVVAPDDGERRQRQAGSRSRPRPCPRSRRPGSPPSPCRAAPRPGAPGGGSRRGRGPRPPRARTGRPRGRPHAGWPGPLVTRSGAPISAAMIIASVVLPSPGGPESSTWSGALPRPRGGVEHQRELVAHHALADELLQPARAQRGLRRTLEVVGAGLDERLGREALGHQLLARRQPCPPPSVRRAARSTAGDLVGRHGPLGALQDGRARRRRPRARSSRARRAPRPPGRAGPRRRRPRAGAVTLAGAPIRSFSSSTMRCAPLRPMPGHALERLEVLVRAPRAAGRRACAPRASPGPAAGPTPLTVCTVSKISRSSASANPNRVSASSRTTSDVASSRGWTRPAAPPGGRRRVHEQAHSPDLDHGGVEPHRLHRAVDRRDHRPPPTSRPIICCRTLWHTQANRCTKTRGQPRRRAACSAVAQARCAAVREPGARCGAPSAPAGRHRWHTARASASAASAGRGSSSSRSSALHHRLDLRLVRPAVPGDRGLDLAGRVQRDRDPAASGGHHRDARDLRGAHHGAQVLLREHPLDRDGVRRVLLEPLLDLPLDRQQALVDVPEGVGRRDADGDHGQPARREPVDDAEAAPGQAGVDSEDAHARSSSTQRPTGHASVTSPAAGSGRRAVGVTQGPAVFGRARASTSAAYQSSSSSAMTSSDASKLA